MTGQEALHEWDAAYVLGALSPDDRREFEAHLEGCAQCQASVAELAGMPALLAKADPMSIESATPAGRLAQSANGDRTLPTLAHRVRRRRLARRWVIAGTATLAAAAIATAVVLPTTLNAPPRAGTEIALEQTTPSPLSATVALTAKRWGTELTMTCRYESAGAYATTGHYALYVTDASGRASRVASWSAWPGATIHASGAVDVQKSQLRTLEIRDTSTDAVLLRSPVR
jgi:hypothetical protein